MKKYRCGKCNYLYDPSEGQLATGVKSNTDWKDVPENWRCPVCGASKDEFHAED